ncbi:MAG: polysaccharide biosynthesis protein [bacterium]|jgi:fatty aldehyde-generating acyl-ACP reductase
MEKFAFILHPISVQDFSRKFGFAKHLPDPVLEGIFKLVPPLKVSHITGVRSEHNAAEGWFVAVPLTPRQMVSLPTDFVLRRIIQAGRIAEKQGAKIVGLGAFTSIVGDAGLTVAKNLNIAVTTGNSYTVATALQGTREAARIMDVDMVEAEIVVLGATGSIGSVCSQILARDAKYMTLVARDEIKLERLARQLLSEYGLSARIATDVKKAVRQADIVVAVSSAVDALIDAEDLKPGAIVCDVARPRSVSRAVAEARNDVLVIEGGVVVPPGDVEFNFNFGFPPGMSYACMAETMLLALERRYENFSLGREMSVRQIEEISALAKKHGFKLAGFRSFERALTSEHITSVKQNAAAKKTQRQVG